MDLIKKFVISPDVINILAADPEFPTQVSASQPQSQPQPQPPKPSLWQRIGGFLKEFHEVVKPVLAVINTLTGALNAFSRFRYATVSSGGMIGA